MSFRTLEITNPTEIHIKNNQLELTQENRQIYIPIEDLSMITTIGSNIRLSTMDLSILANNHVSLTTLDNKYSPTALVLPFEGNSRQSQLIHQQVQFSNAFNLVDDLIEPFRALVDLVAHENIGTNEWLTKAERSSLAHVLHNACLVNGTKVSVLYAIELMSESYKRILMHESEEELVLPTVISIESMEGITE